MIYDQLNIRRIKKLFSCNKCSDYLYGTKIFFFLKICTILHIRKRMHYFVKKYILCGWWRSHLIKISSKVILHLSEVLQMIDGLLQLASGQLFVANSRNSCDRCIVRYNRIIFVRSGRLCCTLHSTTDLQRRVWFLSNLSLTFQFDQMKERGFF